MKGQCGLLFTDCTKQEVTDWFDDYAVEDFARSGFKANQAVTLEEGPLKQFSHAIEPYLRQLGMPTKLDRGEFINFIIVTVLSHTCILGVVTLIKDYEVCKEGSILTPEQAKILELLEHKLATFKLILKAKWTKGEGFETISSGADEDNEEEMKSDDED